MFFQPSKKLYYNPYEAGLNPKELAIHSKDGTKLMGWEFSPKGKVKGWVVQFHGNAGNITSHYPLCVWLTQYGYGLTIVDYRGYGSSEGTAGPEGAEDDAIAVIKDTAKKHKRLIIIGQSLGGPITIRALNRALHEDKKLKKRIKTVVIDSSFVSYQKEAAHFLARSMVTWPLQPIAFLIISDQYSSKSSFEGLSGIPILVMHGDADKIVPLRFGKEVYENASNPKELWIIEGKGHIQLMTDDKIQKQFLDYLERLDSK